MNRLNRWQKQIKSGGNAADRRRSFRVARKIASHMEAEYQASEYGGYGPGCYVCCGSGLSLRWIPDPSGYGGEWGNRKICGCARAPRVVRSRRIVVGGFRVVGRAAGKRQIGRVMRLDTPVLALPPRNQWPTWWPGVQRRGTCHSDAGSWRMCWTEAIRPDLYEKLPQALRDEIECPF